MHRTDDSRKLRFRSVFVSDVHLGSRDCRASELLRFLESIEADYLFLVGDIVDFWSLRRSFYWPETHNEVLRALLAMAREGTKIIYIPGNHDENIREFCGSMFGNVSIRRRFVHSTADGREFLVMHGDEFDSAVKCSRWLARFGATAYEVMMRINRGVNVCRRALGLPHWSLASYPSYACRTPCVTSKPSSMPRRRRRSTATWRASSAGIFIGRACGRSMASSIAMTVTGSKAARHSWRA
jgi:UDP-2,3-diacylglucosamine pyrophosphatase LpxH